MVERRTTRLVMLVDTVWYWLWIKCHYPRWWQWDVTGHALLLSRPLSHHHLQVIFWNCASTVGEDMKEKCRSRLVVEIPEKSWQKHVFYRISSITLIGSHSATPSPAIFIWLFIYPLLTLVQCLIYHWIKCRTEWIFHRNDNAQSHDMKLRGPDDFDGRAETLRIDSANKFIAPVPVTDPPPPTEPTPAAKWQYKENVIFQQKGSISARPFSLASPESFFFRSMSQATTKLPASSISLSSSTLSFSTLAFRWELIMMIAPNLLPSLLRLVSGGLILRNRLPRHNGGLARRTRLGWWTKEAALKTCHFLLPRK